jgi:AraC-like DNA-binding protein
MKESTHNLSLTDSSILDTVTEYIDGHLSERLSVDVLAKLACMSATKLKYCFKPHTGKTVYNYITDMRISRAEKLLAEMDLPIAEIAKQVGYTKPSAFTSVFKAHKGMLPKEYRSVQRMLQKDKLKPRSDNSR